MKYKGIWVAGIPGAGCTLMRRLFLSFKGVNVPEQEMFPDSLVMSLNHYNERGECLVTSRTGESVYSQELDPVEAERQASKLVDNGVGVLLMVRDFASQRRVTEEDWTAAMSDTIIHWDKIHYTLPYPRLVKEPDVVQLEIAEVFGLEVVHKFSDYPDFIDPKTIPKFQDKGCGFEACHRLRRIGAPYEEGVGGTRHRTTPMEMEQNYIKQNGIGPSPEAVASVDKLLSESEKGKDLEVSELGLGVR